MTNFSVFVLVAGLLALSAIILLIGRVFGLAEGRSKRQSRQLRQAEASFHRSREWLEARFLKAASQGGKRIVGHYIKAGEVYFAGDPSERNRVDLPMPAGAVKANNCSESPST